MINYLLNLDYKYYILIGILGIALLALLLILIFKKTNKKIKIDDSLINELIISLGGKDNLKDVGIDNNRLKIQVNNIKLCDLENIKKLSNGSGIAVMNNTIKTVFAYQSKDIKNKIEKVIKE